MDPNTRGPEEYGHDGDGHAPRPRPPRDPLTPDFGQHAPAPARTVRLVTGDFLLTVNPVDGSEIEVCPPTERPDRPAKRTPAERAETERAARPPVPPGPARPALPLLARDEARDRLVRLLARGRSVRLTGPAGSGRTSLLDVVAEDCADLAPDGVVRLSGFHRTADDLLYDLFHAVHRAPRHRPAREELLTHVREIGAVVLLDDLEFGGTALDELLDATPECAFLVAATPDVPGLSADAAVEEVVLTGLDRSDGVALLERAAGRPLTEEEANWAGDLWFESEGLPLRFVQAGALLRRRDRLRAGADAVDEFGVFAAAPEDATPYDTGAGDDVPLPSLGEAAAPAPLLASRLSASARAALEFAVALGGEVPHQAHLPALVGDTHADAALGELAACGLISPVGSRYRLAAGVLTQLESAGYGDDIAGRALEAARHYAWWAGHPSVTPERVCAEADALLAALAVLAPATEVPAEDEESPAVALARTAAPAFAAGLHWGAWERTLRSGAEAARLAGDVAEQAYFHHELGVLALCEDRLDRARAELEASIGLRGAAADRRGTVAGRRALALVTDRSGDTPGPAAGAFGATAGAGSSADGFGAVGGSGAAGGGYGAAASGFGPAEGGPGAAANWPGAAGPGAAASGPGAAAGGRGSAGGNGPAGGFGAAGGVGSAAGGRGPVGGPGSAGGFGAAAGGPGAAVGGPGQAAGGAGSTAGGDAPDARHEEALAPFPPLRPAPQVPTLVSSRSTGRPPGGGPSRKARGGLKGFARRNLVAAGAGALLVAVLGTVVTLGATSEGDTDGPADRVGVNPSASQDAGDGGLGADRREDGDDGSGNPGVAGAGPTDPGPDGMPGTADDPTPTGSATPSDAPTGSRGPTGSGEPSTTPKPPTSGKPPTGTHKPPSGTQKPPTGSQKPSDTPTSSPGTGTPTTPTPTPPPETATSAPVTSASAGDPATASGAPTDSSASAPGGTIPGTTATGQIM